MHISPEAVFMSQILWQLIGVPMNYGTVSWVLDKKCLTNVKLLRIHDTNGMIKD